MTNQQAEIIEALGVKPVIEAEDEIISRTDFLKRYLAAAGMKGFVLGVSGGQDSLLAGLLAQRAVGELQDEGYDASLHLLRLPYGEQADAADARLACRVIGADDVRELNVQSASDSLAEIFKDAYGHGLTDIDKGNVKCRMRMVAQYALMHECQSLVIGTDHAAEAVVGFFTKYGDGGADVVPLSGLTKRQGRQLLRALDAPERFCVKPPTADLLDDRPGQPDEDELGLCYDDIDDYLEGRVVSPDIATEIERRYLQTGHKRHLPVTPFDTWWQQ